MQSDQSFNNPAHINIPFNQTDFPMQNYPTEVDPFAEQQINQGIVQGFGQFFFNALDPNIAKTNVPVKQDS